MSLFGWFKKRESDSDGREYVSDPSLSRRAVDSCDEPMDSFFSMRITNDLRILGGRKARMMGLSLGEYMRFLLAQAVDDDEDTVPNRIDRNVSRKGGTQ
jgi:hypothetical protein